MPASFVQYGESAFGGFAEAYPKDTVAAFAAVKDEGAQKELKAAADAAGKAMADLRDWLKSQEGSATQGFALGADKFSHMLLATEGVDTPLDQLEAIGQADLKRNRDALIAECAKFAPGKTVPECMTRMNAHKPEGGPVAAATKQVPELRDFVIKNDIVSIPGTGASSVL